MVMRPIYKSSAIINMSRRQKFLRAPVLNLTLKPESETWWMKDEWRQLIPPPSRPFFFSFLLLAFTQLNEICAITAGEKEERALELTSSFIKPFMKPNMAALWFPWDYSFRKAARAYYSPSVLRTFNHSKCEFNLFLSALIHRKLLNGLKLTPDSTVTDVYKDNFQWGPLKIFCTFFFLAEYLNGGDCVNVLVWINVTKEIKIRPKPNWIETSVLKKKPFHKDFINRPSNWHIWDTFYLIYTSYN